MFELHLSPAQSRHKAPYSSKGSVRTTLCRTAWSRVHCSAWSASGGGRSQLAPTAYQLPRLARPGGCVAASATTSGRYLCWQPKRYTGRISWASTGLYRTRRGPDGLPGQSRKLRDSALAALTRCQQAHTARYQPIRQESSNQASQGCC
jgi:hypothetical protein